MRALIKHLKRLTLVSTACLITFGAGGCTLFGGFLENYYAGLLFWEALPAIPVSPYQSQLIEDNNELTRMALTDNLTGLSNRTHMNQILHKEFARFERHNQRFGIIMIDIDHFKSVNDNFGHDAGDKLLKKLARVFQGAIRTSDSVARWGGEEFMICCTTIEESDLLPIAETIRKLVASTRFERAGKMTASLGCAAIVKGETIGDLIKRADIVLYEAKNNGRNQSIVSEFTDLTPSPGLG